MIDAPLRCVDGSDMSLLLNRDGGGGPIIRPGAAVDGFPRCVQPVRCVYDDDGLICGYIKSISWMAQSNVILNMDSTTYRIPEVFPLSETAGISARS